MQLNLTKKPLALILLVLLLPVLLYWQFMHPRPLALQAQKAPKVLDTRLANVVDECAGIADKAVANMQAIVEFQKLEIEGRKFNVMRRCMDDRGLIENPQWLAYAAPLAKAMAKQQHISEDEAIENLRRSQMINVKPIANQPIYWQPRHQ